MKTRTMYMHTMDGRPASFDKHAGYLYFVSSYYSSNVRLVPSLRQIRREQTIARETCADIPREPRYDYVRVAIPTEHEGVLTMPNSSRHTGVFRYCERRLKLRSTKSDGVVMPYHVTVGAVVHMLGEALEMSGPCQGIGTPPASRSVEPVN